MTYIVDFGNGDIVEGDRAWVLRNLWYRWKSRYQRQKSKVFLDSLDPGETGDLISARFGVGTNAGDTISCTVTRKP